MAKYSGKVGYLITKESVPGVWEPQVIKKHMRGDILHNVYRRQEEAKVNDDVSINMRISVVADKFAFANFMHIKFVEFAGECWTVNSVEVFRPRLILNITGVYDGETT